MRKILILFLIICGIGNTAFAANEANVSSAPSKTTTTQLWNLHDVDIHNLIDVVAHSTGKNFVVDSRVQGKVNVVSTRHLNDAEIYPVFLAILQVYGYAAVPSGHIIKIVPSEVATQSNLTLVNQSQKAPGDQIVVRVVALKNNSAEQLVPVLRPLLPPSGNISVYMPTNTLILAGNATTVQNLAELVNHLDTVNNKDIDIIPLHYASADDVVKELTTLLMNNFGGNSNVSLSADTQSNSVLVRGNTEQRLSMRQLINRLDNRASISSNGNTQVFYLHYLKAKELVPILAGVIAKSQDTNDSAAYAAAAAPTPTTTENNANNAAANNTPTAIAVNANNQTIRIEAEPNTNAIIITAPPDIMKNLRNVIMKLDIRPSQVLVEAAIVEIDESRLRRLGVDWGTRQVGESAPTIATDAQFNMLTGGLGVGFIHSGSLKVMIDALSRDGSTNILSTPTIIMMDNQKADIKVGKNIPFVIGSYSTSSGGSLNNPYTTTKREYVGLELKVTPQINQGDAVRLLIDQGNESISDGNTNSTNPITDVSRIKTSVLVTNGEILVLGGLMSNQMAEIVHKVPILGDIPGVGLLFRNKQHTLEKKNLMVFLRPVILRSTRDNEEITTTKYNATRNEEIRTFDRTLDSGFNESSGILPPMHGRAQLPEPFTAPDRQY